MREEVLALFRRVRRRHVLVRGWDLFLEWAFFLTIGTAAVFLMDRLVFELGMAAPLFPGPAAVVLAMAGALGAGALAAAGLLMARPTAPARIAWQIDRASGGEDRFLSALELAARGDDGSFADALFADAARVARRAEPARVMPRAPMGHRWGILLSLATAALLCVHPLQLYDAPAADFDLSPDRGPAPLEVAFRDASTGAIDAFLWDFGDEGTASGELVRHVFETPGRYPVRLRLRGPGGASEKTREVEILPSDRPVADFEAEPRKGRARLDVRFRNLSRNAESYEWDFGDGGTSEDAAPSHSYQEPGLYTVRLRARNAAGADDRLHEQYIKVAHPDAPLANFHALPREGEAPLEVLFEDLSLGEVSEWRWDFGDARSGDGNGSFERNPSHTFRTAGYYTVRLRVRGPRGEDDEEKARYIHVRGDRQGPGGGGASDPQARGPRAPPRPGSGGAGDRRGRDFGEPTERPRARHVPEGVKPHTVGGAMAEKLVVLSRPGGGAGVADRVPYGQTFFDERKRVAEESVNREFIPPAIREIVRSYFELTRPE